MWLMIYIILQYYIYSYTGGYSNAQLEAQNINFSKRFILSVNTVLSVLFVALLPEELGWDQLGFLG